MKEVILFTFVACRNGPHGLFSVQLEFDTEPYHVLVSDLHKTSLNPTQMYLSGFEAVITSKCVLFTLTQNCIQQEKKNKIHAATTKSFK